MAKRLFFGVMLTVTGMRHVAQGITNCPEESYRDQNEMLAPCSKLCKQNMPVWEVRNCRTHCPETFECLQKTKQESATPRPSASTPSILNATKTTQSTLATTAHVNVAESVQSVSVNINHTAVILGVVAFVICLCLVVAFIAYHRHRRLQKREERRGTTSRPADRPHRANLCGCSRAATVAPEDDAGKPLAAEDSDNDKIVCAPSGQKLPEQMETLV